MVTVGITCWTPGDDDARRGRHRRGRVATRDAVAAPLLYRVTDARTLVAHLVAEDELAAGRRSGRFRTVCGEIMHAASLTVEERAYCRSCARWQPER